MNRLFILLGMSFLTSCAPSISSDDRSADEVGEASNSSRPKQRPSGTASIAESQGDYSIFENTGGSDAGPDLVANKNVEIDKVEALISTARSTVLASSNQISQIRTTGKTYVQNGNHLQKQLKIFKQKLAALEITLDSTKGLVKVGSEKTREGMKVEYVYDYNHGYYDGLDKKITVGHTGRVKKLGEKATQTNYKKLLAEHKRAVGSVQSIEGSLRAVKTKLTSLKVELTEAKARLSNEQVSLSELNSQRERLLSELLILKQ